MLSVDEKPHIQALERAQGYLKLANGRTLSGRTLDLRRYGTTTLFAALDVATGAVETGHWRRRVAFLDFMNKDVAAHGDREIHVILDNINTYKPKHGGWLARDRNMRFHFPPTHASCRNQVEIVFSILGRGALAGKSFISPSQLRRPIDAFVDRYSDRARPFSRQTETVHQNPSAHVYPPVIPGPGATTQAPDDGRLIRSGQKVEHRTITSRPRSVAQRSPNRHRLRSQRQSSAA